MAGVKGMHDKRSKSPSHVAAFIERVQAGVLGDRLHKHALGKIEMTATQVRAAEIMLRKVVPDLSSVDSRVTGNVIVNIVD